MTYQILEASALYSEFIDTDVSSLALSLKDERQKFQVFQVADAVALGNWHEFYQPTSQLPRPTPEAGSLVAYSPLYNYIMISDPNTRRGLYQLNNNEIIYGPDLTPIHRQRDAIEYDSTVKYFTSQSLNDVLGEFVNRGFSQFQSNSMKFNESQPALLQDRKPFKLNF